MLVQVFHGLEIRVQAFFLGIATNTTPSAPFRINLRLAS